jgi:hypothetical protein
MAGNKKDGTGKGAAKPSVGKTSVAKRGAGETGADRRVAQLRNKLTDAMQDPLTRDQIVRAIRALMQEK